MVVQCPGCETKYNVPDEKIRKGLTQLRCSRCGKMFSLDVSSKEAASGDTEAEEKAAEAEEKAAEAEEKAAEAEEKAAEAEEKAAEAEEKAAEAEEKAAEVEEKAAEAEEKASEAEEEAAEAEEEQKPALVIPKPDSFKKTPSTTDEDEAAEAEEEAAEVEEEAAEVEGGISQAELDAALETEVEEDAAVVAPETEAVEEEGALEGSPVDARDEEALEEAELVEALETEPEAIVEEEEEGDSIGALIAQATEAAEAAAQAAEEAQRAESAEEAKRLAAEASKAAAEARKAAEAVAAAKSQTAVTAPNERPASEQTTEIDAEMLELAEDDDDVSLSSPPAKSAPPAPPRPAAPVEPESSIIVDPALEATDLPSEEDVAVELDDLDEDASAAPASQGGGAADWTEEIEEPLPSSGSGLKVLGVIMAVVIVAGAVGGLYFFGVLGGGEAAGVDGVDTIGVEFVEARRDGGVSVLMVRGRVVNTTAGARQKVAVNAQVLDSRGEVVTEREVPCGRTFTRDDLRQLTNNEIQQEYSRLEQSKRMVGPNDDIVCSAVIENIPAGFSKRSHRPRFVVIQADPVSYGEP